MASKKHPILLVVLEKFVGGGQVIGTVDNGLKVFVWGGLPGETVRVQVTKAKKSYAEAVVVDVEKASPERQQPKDTLSFLSTSPWQILTLENEQRIKADLIAEAFQLHGIHVADHPRIYTDGRDYHYRNKIEFSFWFDADTHNISLAFYRRGTHGKIPVDGTTLVPEQINAHARALIKILNNEHIEGWQLKTVIIRITQHGEIAWQLYVKDEQFMVSLSLLQFAKQTNGEIIYSNPKSPASIITNRLTPRLKPLEDTILGTAFQYATESFFQINLPVYEKALKDMQQWIPPHTSVLDLYSGVGTIGLTIGGENITLIESNKQAVEEMKANIKKLHKTAAQAILAPSEQSLEYISLHDVIIVDPPRAGLHNDVVQTLLNEQPSRIIYLSCNPVTQARDISLLYEKYRIVYQQGYNFFPHTPHIENLIVLDLNE